MTTLICRRGGNLKYSDFIDRLDYDALYADLNWEPKESSGSEDKGFCLMPWNHKNGDATGKMAINRDKGLVNCWVCGGSSILSLIMEVKKMDLHTANNYLYQFTKSDKINPADFYNKIQRMLAEEDGDQKVAPYFNDRILERWRYDHVWLKDRGISSEVAEYFKLGYDPCAKRISKDGDTYDGPGIIIPHFWETKLVGWQTRWLNPDRPKWIPKYTNTMDFPREETLWGYDFAKKQTKQPILVESVPTALFLISEGYPSIATFGAQVTSAQLKLLRVFQQGVMLAPDNDSPGYSWFDKASGYLERYVPVLQVPYVDNSGADLGDLSIEELSMHLQGTKPWFGFGSHT